MYGRTLNLRPRPGHHGPKETKQSLKKSKRAVRAVSHSRDYHDRLSELKLQSLAESRIEADMVLTHKILSDSDTQFSEQWFEKAATRRPTRQSSGRDNLIPKRGNHEFRRGFFSHRVVDNWNLLPDAVKEATSAGAFKNRYRQHLETSAAWRNQQAARTTR
jgi:hypothetical protein